MAGIKQHFIPQVIQRGFEAAKSGKHTQVLVFRKGAQPYLSSTEGVAAKRHFYSQPVPGEKTLDDLITEYEKDVLSPAIASLRVAPLGEVDPEVAASVVTHLSIRAAFVRGAIGEIGSKFVEHMSQMLQDKSATRAFFGVDSSGASMLVESLEAELVKSLPHLPREGVERLVRMFRFRFREHYDTDFAAMPGAAARQMGMFADLLPSAIEGAHLKALERELVPAERTEKLKSLRWELLEVPAGEHVVLPDCLAVATASDSLEDFEPYTLADIDAAQALLMPVCSTRVLVGCRPGLDLKVEWSRLNESLAKACLEFFISSRRDPDTEGLAHYIGRAVSSMSRELVEAESFAAPQPERPARAASRPAAQTRTPRLRFAPLNLQTKKLSMGLRAQVQSPQIAPYLSRLQALTVTQDVASLLESRGVVLNDYTRQQVQLGTCYDIPGSIELECEVLLPLVVAQALIGADKAQGNSAGTLVRHHLGRAAFLHFYRASVSDEDLTAKRELLESLLMTVARFAASHYFGARLGAPPAFQQRELELADQMSANHLRAALEGLTRSREQFAQDRNVDTLLQNVFLCLEVFLSTAGPAAVMRKAAPKSWMHGQCAQVLEEFSLTKWFDLFALDMDAYFEAREAWSGPEELEFLTTHAERLVWGAGFYFSSAGGQIRVDTFSDQEMTVVAALLGGTSFAAEG
jgi:hypothetical protein